MENQRRRKKKELYESLKKLDSGNGLFISVGDTRGDKVDTKYVYDIESRPLTLEQSNTKKKLTISFDSTENENRELLHFLFSKTKQL